MQQFSPPNLCQGTLAAVASLMEYKHVPYLAALLPSSTQQSHQLLPGINFSNKVMKDVHALLTFNDISPATWIPKSQTISTQQPYQEGDRADDNLYI
jgi:hypothetical protein